MAWHENELNQAHLERLRAALADDGRVLVFLGAGLSFGSARQTGRARFDNEHWGADPGGPGYGRRPPYGFHVEIVRARNPERGVPIGDRHTCTVRIPYDNPTSPQPLEPVRPGDRTTRSVWS